MGEKYEHTNCNTLKWELIWQVGFCFLHKWPTQARPAYRGFASDDKEGIY